MARALCGVLGVVAALVPVVAADARQGQPDLSGRWILVTGSHPVIEAPRALTVEMAVQSTTARGEPMAPYFRRMTVVRELDGRESSESHRLGVVGGTVSGTRDGTRSRTTYGAVWEGQSLVIERSVLGSAGAHRQERREAWSLDAEGRLHLDIRVRTDATENTVELIYERQ